MPYKDKDGQWWYEGRKVVLIIPPPEIQEQWKKELLNKNSCGD